MSMSLIDIVEAGFLKDGIQFKRLENGDLRFFFRGVNIRVVEMTACFIDEFHYFRIISQSVGCRFEGELYREAVELCCELTRFVPAVKFFLDSDGEATLQFDSYMDEISGMDSFKMGIACLGHALEDTYPRFMALRWA